MPIPASPVSWLGSLWWLLGLAALSFVVTWVTADKLRMRRMPYIGVLTVVTVGLSVGYVQWLGVGVIDVLTARWGWGLLAAPLAGAFMVIGIARLPVVHRISGAPLGVAMAWEAIVYGVVEGALLSALPVFMTWQMIHSLGWSGVGGGIARWTLPIVASVVVTVVHHLGYWEYRNSMLGPISLACGLLAVGYVVTASPIAPTLGHVLGHASGLLHGAELPPHPHPAQGSMPPSAPQLAGTGGR
jgi:hypothetical protein